MSTEFDHLILFPDGTAFSDLPSKPITRFDAATLRAALRPNYVGRWKQQGTSLVVTFAGKTETYRKHLDGWYSDTDTPKPDYLYQTYYPVTALSAKEIQGVWKNTSLTVMGTAGGGAPMVAAGSNSNLLFRADGTFSTARDGFFSATTANMGDALKTGGSVTSTGTNKKSGVGRWRLDGLLLTTEQNGQREVRPAFFIPHWGESRDLLIGGDRWERPETK